MSLYHLHTRPDHCCAFLRLCARPVAQKPTDGEPAPHCASPAAARIVGGLSMINDSKKLAAALQEVFIRCDAA